MSLYKIMIVDDEEEIREGIRRKIDWNACGFELVASAENGQEALELAETLQPDVVITDIKMPFMDGLELARRLSETMRTTKIIVFSGFDDFEYAQKAIQYNVSDYILKPVGAEELTTLLTNTRAQLDVEIATRSDMQTLRERYTRSLPLLRELFFTRLMDGQIPSQRIQEQAEFYGAELGGSAWSVALIQMDAVQNSNFKDAKELVPVSVRQLLDDILGKRIWHRTTLYGDTVGVIAGFANAQQVMELIDALNGCCMQAKRFLGVPLTIGVGAVCHSLDALRTSTQSALTALEYRALMGGGQVIYIGDVEPVQAANLLFSEQDARELSTAIKLGEGEQITRCAQAFLARFRELHLPLSQCQLFFTEMVTELVKIMRDFRIEPEKVFGDDFDGSFRIARFSSPEELSAWFTECCLAVSSQIRRERMNSSQALAEKARLYIAEHYADPALSADALCGHLHLSPAYFSTMFKRETGASFVAYLTDTRLDAAIKLLATGEYKTYEVSERVGYLEPNYFSYVFKKRFGMSPTKYLASKEG